MNNVGTIDRVLRVGASLVLAGTALFAHPSGSAELVLWIGAMLMLVTGATGICPLYSALRLSTRFHNNQRRRTS